MAVKLRPRHAGAPKSPRAQLATSRKRAEEVEADASPPPSPLHKPAVTDTQLKSIDDRLDRIEGKIDDVLDVLTDDGSPAAEAPQA